METVELRVHGVHGTSPGSMLGVSDGEVGQVAGDKLTGIYRVKSGSLPYRKLDGTGISVEAYSWGALTSGIQGFLGWVKRVLWLLLLPFALANLAYWARLEVGTSTGQARWGARAVRASGLFLTVFLVLTPCVVAIDMVAWQCYRYDVPGCARLPGQLDFLARWTATQRIGAATLVPMLVVLVLFLLSRTSLARYENVTDRADEPPVLATRPILLHEKLWEGKARTERMQRLHLTGAVAAVVGFTGLHVLNTKQGPTPGLVLATTITAGALGAIATLLLLATHEDDMEHQEGDSSPTRSTMPLLVLMLAVYVVHLLALAYGGTELDQANDYFARDHWFIGIFILLTAMHLSIFMGGRMPARLAVTLVLALFAGSSFLLSLDRITGWALAVALTVLLLFWLSLTLWHYRGPPRRQHKDKAWLGAGASVMLAAAAWIALLFTSAVVIASANYLNGSNQGVGDLVALVDVEESPDDGEPLPTTYNVEELDKPASYVATGDVVVSKANVTVEGSTVVVHSGAVQMAGLSLNVPDDYVQDEPFTESRGTTIVRRESTLTIPKATVTLTESCLAPGSQCSAEDRGYHIAGVLEVPASELVIRPTGDVVLEPRDAPEVPLAVPKVLIWTPMGQLLWLVLVLLGTAVCFGLFQVRAAPDFRGVLGFGKDWKNGLPVGSPDDEVPPRDRRRCVQRRTSAGFAHRAETLLDVTGAITAPVALLVIAMSLTRKPPWHYFDWTREYSTASMYLVVGMSAGLLLLGSQIRRSEQTRKAVGVIWDLTTFWPRAAHPLAPPCYAERVIPELHTRVRWALEADPRNRVVLSGHSQGSLIVTSMVSRLQPEHLGRIDVITYGSQVRQLYGRMFPRVFGADAIGYEPTKGAPSLVDAWPDVPRPGTPGPPLTPPPDSLRARLVEAGGSWVNLFRRTDPLGFRVFSDADSLLDVAVPEVPLRLLGDPGPVVQGHSGYQHTLAYRRQVQAWTKEEPLLLPLEGTRDAATLPPP